MQNYEIVLQAKKSRNELFCKKLHKFKQLEALAPNLLPPVAGDFDLKSLKRSPNADVLPWSRSWLQCRLVKQNYGHHL